MEDADWLQVRLSDGRRFNGKVVGQDTRVDLALVRIDGASNLPTLPLGDSNRVRVGEFVLDCMPPQFVSVDGEPVTRTPVRGRVARQALLVRVPNGR